jgi:hypothetical protein
MALASEPRTTQNDARYERRIYLIGALRLAPGD